MTILNADRLAEQAIDRYYDDDIYDHDTLTEYLGSYYSPGPDDLTQTDLETPKELHQALKTALAADIHDLLHNGNDEDLAWSEADVDAIRAGDYYAGLEEICSLIAAKLIARIYPEGL